MAKKQQTKKKRAGKKGKNATTGRSAAVAGIPRPVTLSKIAPRREAKKAHHTAVCSITDPFCIHARSAQRPDGGPPSIPFQVRQLINVTADTTTGTCRYVFVPGGGLFWGDINSTVTSKWDGGASWQTAAQTMLSNLADEIRIVSFGVMLRSVMSATTAKGMAIVATDSAPKLGAQQITKGIMAGGESNLISVAAGTSQAWVSKPMGPLAHAFHPVAKFTSTMTDFDWTSCVIEVVGGDTTSGIAYFSAEYVMNVEFTIRTGANSAGATAAYGMTQLHKAPPPPNNLAIKAADRVHAVAPSFIEGTIDKVGAYLSKHATDALDSIMSEGLAMLTL